MKLKTYKTLYGYYNGPSENNINLPENIKLVYDDGEIGDGLTNGHNHYIGFIKYTDDIAEEELVNDMMMLIASFSGKVYSLRARENRKKRKLK